MAKVSMLLGKDVQYEIVENNQQAGSARSVHPCPVAVARSPGLRRLWWSRWEEPNRASHRPYCDCVERSGNFELERLPRGPVLRRLAWYDEHDADQRWHPLPACIRPESADRNDFHRYNGHEWHDLLLRRLRRRELGSEQFFQHSLRDALSETANANGSPNPIFAFIRRSQVHNR